MHCILISCECKSLERSKYNLSFLMRMLKVSRDTWVGGKEGRVAFWSLKRSRKNLMEGQEKVWIRPNFTSYETGLLTVLMPSKINDESL